MPAITNAWAMRNSTLNVGNGDDNVELRATTRAGAFFEVEDSTIFGNGRDTCASTLFRDRLVVRHGELVPTRVR